MASDDAFLEQAVALALANVLENGGRPFGALVVKDGLIVATGVNEIGATEIVRTGNLYYLARAELRFPLVGALFGGIFADIGNVWADASLFTGTPRWNAGLGLRVATPIGPIALDYGFNLDRRTDLNEPFGSLHFSIGLF